MLAGFFQGIVHDRKLMREAQVNLAIRWFAGYRLDEKLPDHSSLTKIRQRWGAERFRLIFERTVTACMEAGLVNGEMVHVDSSLIRADVSWESLTTRHTGQVLEENGNSEDSEDNTSGPGKVGRPRTKPPQQKRRSTTDPDATMTTNNQAWRMQDCRGRGNRDRFPATTSCGPLAIEPLVLRRWWLWKFGRFLLVRG